MRKFITLILFTLCLSILYPRNGQAGVTCSLPFTLTNGTTADATQVMANYNALVTCLSNAAAAGANADITALLSLTTPLTPASGGANMYFGGTSGGAANVQTIASTTPSNFALTTGKSVLFIAGFTNSGATTLNVNALGAVNVFKTTPGGAVAMTGGEIVAGQFVFAVYDGTQFQMIPALAVTAGWGIAVSGGGSTVSIATTNPPFGFNPCVNMQLNVTVSGNNLIVALKGNNGSDPSATNPVLCAFHDTTEANGDPVWISTTAALSFQANSGSSFGSTNAVPARFWIVGFNNAGSLALGVVNASATRRVFPLNEGMLTSTTACASCGTATVAGTFYTTTALTSQAFRILGYFEATETTAGTWVTAPTRVKLFGPGVRKPGDIVQKISSAAISGSTTCNNTQTQTTITVTLTPSSNVNLVEVQTQTSILVGTGPTQTTVQLSRGASPTLIGNQVITNQGANTSEYGSFYALDSPATAASQAYFLYCTNSASIGTVNAVGTSVISATEIMGELPEPANDNPLIPLSKAA